MINRVPLNTIKNYKLQIVIAFISSLITAIAFRYAEAYAWYLFNEIDPVNYIFKADPIYNLLCLIFFIPFIVITFNKNNSKIRLLWLILSLLLMILNLLTIGNGGDQKGCVECDVSFMFNLFILPIPALICIVYGLIKWKKA